MPYSQTLLKLIVLFILTCLVKKCNFKTIIFLPIIAMNKDHKNLRLQHKKNYFRKRNLHSLKQGPIKTTYFYSVVYFLTIKNFICHVYNSFILNYLVCSIFHEKKINPLKRNNLLIFL